MQRQLSLADGPFEGTVVASDSLIEKSDFSLYKVPENFRDLQLVATIGRGIQEGVGSGPTVHERAAKFFDGLDKIFPEPSEKSTAVKRMARGETARIVIRAGLRAPLPQNARAGRGGQLHEEIVPLTPMACRLTGFLKRGKKDNAYKPIETLRGMIFRGTPDCTKREECWRSLQRAFFVGLEGDTPPRDPWSVLVESALIDHPDLLDDAINPPKEAGLGQPDPDKTPSPGYGTPLQYQFFPSKSLVRDLPRLAKLEAFVGRRLWIALLDCYLRLAFSANTFWSAHTQRKLADIMLNPQDRGDASLGEFLTSGFEPMQLNAHLDQTVEKYCRDYQKSKYILSAFCAELSEKDVQEIEMAGGISTEEGSHLLLEGCTRLSTSQRAAVASRWQEDVDDPTKIKKGVSNLQYSLRYGLGQREPKNGERTFDQGYWACKTGDYRKAPWEFRLSPVGIVLAVHLSSRERNPATAYDLREWLREYGFCTSITDLSSGEVGKHLRYLGLVTDSSDAEGGMILRDPLAESAGASQQ